MSRKINDTMDKIFEVLKKYVNEDDVSRIVQIKRHLIADGDEQPIRDFVKSSKVNIASYNYMRIISFYYKEQKYVLIPKKYESTIQQLGLDFETDSAILQGAGMIAISEECLTKDPKITSLKIIDNCLGLTDDMDSENVSIQFSQILNMFISYCLVKMDEDRFQFQFKEDIHRFYGYIITENCSQFTINTMDRLKSILLFLSSRSIAISIINCIESQLIEYSFLQLYQCLEYLFIINNSLKMSDTHSISKAKAIDIVTSYKLKISEEENLYQVLKNNTTETAIQVFFDIINNGTEEISDKYRTVTAYIYKIRCNIAHLRYNQSNIIYNVEWKKMMDAISEVIYSIYQQLDNSIIHICSDKLSWEKIEWKI